MEIFPEKLREVWNKWELRVLVLLSLSWQILLIIFGSQRKYRRSSFISFLVWVIYLSADWLATVSLGTLANDQGYSSTKSQAGHLNHVLKALWAPFLLFHLGGPDTITAYSLEDNNLWLRHLLGLLVQVAVAFYIFIRSWTNTALTFIAISVFIAGITKYSERTWVLRSASSQQSEDSLLSTSASTQQPSTPAEYAYLHEAYSLFSLLKRLYANLSLRFAEGQISYSMRLQDAESSCDNAFQLVEVRLGFLYDVLYTKATIIYSLVGIVFRFITFFCTLSALFAFHFFIDRQFYSRIDIYITYALFIGAVFLEIYAVISLVSSDWMMRWLTEKNSLMRKICYHTIYYCYSFSSHRRWSKSIAQHNLLNFCMKQRVTRCIGTDLFFRIYFTLELYWQRTWGNVDFDLKKLTFEYLLRKREAYEESGFDFDGLKSLLAHKGDSVLKVYNCLGEIGWSVEVEFDRSLLVWHVATDLCFYNDPKKHQDINCRASKKISDYMLYLLLMRPFMLPKWIDRFTYVRDTYREVVSVLHRKGFQVKRKAEACNVMLQLHTQCQSLELVRREKSSKSVLHDACRLAEQLRHQSDPWEMICQVWIEKLIYAASHCEWQAHAQQLRRGGELLTHVCLLMADLGLSEQFDLGRRGSKIGDRNVGWGWGRTTM